MERAQRNLRRHSGVALVSLYLLYKFIEFEKSNLFPKNEGQDSCPPISPPPPLPALAKAESSSLLHTQGPQPCTEMSGMPG